MEYSTYRDHPKNEIQKLSLLLNETGENIEKWIQLMNKSDSEVEEIVYYALQHMFDQFEMRIY